MIKLDIYNPNAAIDTELFKPFWYNFADYYRRQVGIFHFKLTDSDDILDEHGITLINNEIYFDNQEDMIAFILKWS